MIVIPRVCCPAMRGSTVPTPRLLGEYDHYHWQSALKAMLIFVTKINITVCKHIH